MKILVLGISTILLLPASIAFGQDNMTTEDYERDAALLKARQAYYDQLLATARSEEAAANAESAFELARLTQANQIRSAELTADLAVATAVKSSGLSAATGKEGGITLASAEKTPLALRAGSLTLVEDLAINLCSQLSSPSGLPKVFIAPTNYELLVQKSMHDVVQVSSLNDAATNGLSQISSIQTQSVTAIAGALVTAQYLAGGAQALSKLSRTDYSLTYLPTDRRALFEQQLTIRCADRIEGNVEGRLRLEAAKILHAWIVNMTSFVERYDATNTITMTEKARITAKIAEIRADEDIPAEKKAADLKALNAGLDALKDKEVFLDTYKGSVASIKAFLASDKTSIFESFIWGHDYLPITSPTVRLDSLHRLSYTLTVEDALLKSSAAFRADRIRPFSTAELTYVVHDETGIPVSSGYWSRTSGQQAVKMKSLTFGQAAGYVAKPASPSTPPTSPASSP